MKEYIVGYNNNYISYLKNQKIAYSLRRDLMVAIKKYYYFVFNSMKLMFYSC